MPICPEQRRAIEMAYHHGLSHREIAARLGQPPGMVEVRVMQGDGDLGAETAAFTIAPKVVP